jgi:hypothetical protein
MKITMLKLVALAMLALNASHVLAFPPALQHTFYGLVRDEYGNPLAIANAEVILETGSGALVRTTIKPNLDIAVNYRLAVSMDAGLTDDLYKPTALRPAAPFRIKVKIGNATYVPIEMSADSSAIGLPGQFTRLNLTLGQDSDGDGIPDAWERALLAMTANNGALGDIRPGDDSDHDGMSNLDEYLAGTYAFDGANEFALNLSGFESGAALLDFTAVTGRTYTVQGSSDLLTWTTLNFRIAGAPADAQAQNSYRAEDVAPIQIKVQPSVAGVPQFFRLTVQ